MNSFQACVGMGIELKPAVEFKEIDLLEGTDAYLAVYSKDGNANFAFYHKEGHSKHLAVLLHYIGGPGVRTEIDSLIKDALPTGESIVEDANLYTQQYRPVLNSAIIQPLAFRRGE